VDIQKLLDIMTQLRDPGSGCPWDRAQRFETIAPYTIEEAYEVADAIERGAIDELKSELGDLLFQVVFHAQLASEIGAFSFDDVVEAICDKLTRRHPHVFGDTSIASADEQADAWETLKAQERGDDEGVLGGIPLALPALTRGEKLGRRAARVGYEWPDISGAREKVSEEIDELDEAIAEGQPARIEAEMGDVFFALVNVCRHLGIDPEVATRGANRRFQTRFEYVERKVNASSRSWDSFSLAELETFWVEAKAQGL
jgi:ATP diphosphatase